MDHDNYGGNGRAPSGRRFSDPGFELGFMDCISWLWERKFWIAGSVLVCAAIFVAYSYTKEPIYTAQVTMLPQSSAMPSGLLGRVANLAGVSPDAEENFEQLYGRILISDPIVRAASQRKWAHRDYQDSVSLYEIFSIELEDETEDFAFNRLKKRFIKGVDFYRDNRSGFMVLRAHMPRDRNTAADFANYLADQLQEFLQSSKTEKAHQKREFLELRIDEVAASLEVAANAVTEFASTNRSYAGSPKLLQEYNKLEREVDARSSVYMELRRQLEVAKLDEQQQTPIVNVLDRALPPEKRSSPRRLLFLVLGGLIGFVTSIGAMVLLDRRKAEAPRQFGVGAPPRLKEKQKAG